MKRVEHLQWCKNRAIEILNNGDITGAWTSMVSDLSKHEETRNHAAIELGMMMVATGNLSTSDKMKNFIEGFN